MPTPTQGTFRRALLYSAAGWIGLGVLRTVVRVVMIPRPLDAAALALLRALVVLLPWIVATPLVLRLASTLPWVRGRRRRTFLAHAGAALALWLADASWSWFALKWTGTPLFVGFRPFVVAQLEQTVFIYAAVVALAAGVRHARSYRAAALAAARLEARLLEARLHVLALQLQPHFLFNTLNAVTELVHRDTEAARRVLRNLRELLGRALHRETAQEVPLRDELALLDSYVQIQRIRFAGTLSVEVDAAPETLDALVPRLVIQPLVENAIRHGTSRRTGPGRIAVRARRDGGRILLEVEDDGVGPPARGVRAGLGLGNTRERLAQLYGDGFHLSLSPGAERGSLARVEVPWRIEGHAVSPAGGEDEAAEQDTEAPVAIEATRLEGELAGIRLEALRWQLQPEFLLAALDAIARLCERHPSKAEELTARLGDLLRILLAGVGSDTASLASEVAFLESYVEIEGAIGAADVALDVRIAPGSERAVVPVRLLQPMAAMVAGSRGPATIALRAERRGAELRVVAEGGTAMGAESELQARQLRERLERIYGAEAHVETVSASASATVTVRLPWREHREAGHEAARVGAA